MDKDSLKELIDNTKQYLKKLENILKVYDNDSDDSDSDSDEELVIKKNPGKVKTKTDESRSNKHQVNEYVKNIFDLDSNLITYDDLKRRIDNYILANQLDNGNEISLDNTLKKLFDSSSLDIVKKKGPGLSNLIKKKILKI